MDKFMKLNWAVLILSLLGIVLSVWLIPDWAEKILVVFTICLFFVAVQQNFAAQSSAHAADVSAQAAADSQHQATYIHLASLWYQIKQRGLECDDFINPEFTTLFRQEESLTKYRQYHVYAWMCWGHAEDCYSEGFRDDEGFLPSIENYKELHYAWLSAPKHYRMFGTGFTDWVNKRLLTPEVKVKAENTRQGNGVFATSQYNKGDFIGYFSGSLVKNRTQMSLQFGPDFHVEPAADSPFRNLNHSCDANACFAGRNLYARRDIRPDEEIIIDYNCHELELASPFKCNCEVTGCVGEIKGYKYLTHEQKQQRQEQICAWFQEGE
jgi:SET domain-containing protein